MTQPDTEWVSASNEGACVELAGEAGHVLVRNSRHPDGEVLDFTPEEMGVFFAGVKAGKFDHLLPE